MSLLSLLAQAAQQPAASDTTRSFGGSIGLTAERFTDFLLDYAIALAAVGALGMAIIEAWKKLFDTRTKFHAKRFTRWIEESLLDAQPQLPGSDPPSATAAIADVIVLCTGVSRNEANARAAELARRRGRLRMLHAFDPEPEDAVFALEIERMMGAIQEAGDAALASPTQFRSLYAFMTTGAAAEDVRAWFGDARSKLAEIGGMDELGPKERQEVKDLTETAARLRQVMKRKLDGFQLYTASRWASYNQTAAIALGFVLMIGVVAWIENEGRLSLDAGEMIIVSALGGILSPIAKDLVTSLKRVKTGG